MRPKRPKTGISAAQPAFLGVSFLGVYGDRRVASLLFFGFSSGLPLALTGATLAVWLTEAGVDLTNIGLVSLVGLAYALKFLWSPLVDRMAIPGLTSTLGRRRGWMLLFRRRRRAGDGRNRPRGSGYTALDDCLGARRRVWIGDPGHRH